MPSLQSVQSLLGNRHLELADTLWEQHSECPRFVAELEVVKLSIVCAECLHFHNQPVPILQGLEGLTVLKEPHTVALKQSILENSCGDEDYGISPGVQHYVYTGKWIACDVKLYRQTVEVWYANTQETRFVFSALEWKCDFSRFIDDLQLGLATAQAVLA